MSSSATHALPTVALSPPHQTMMHLSRSFALAAAGAFAVAFAVAAPAGAQAPRQATAGYHAAANLEAVLDSMARSKPSLVRVTTIATTPGNRPVQLVRLGAGGDVDTRPALLIVANAAGPHLVGSEIALRAVRALTIAHGSAADTTRLLDRVTIYVVPRANPDAAESFFAGVRRERAGNDATHDDDRDAAVNEDGTDDLNGDGLITMMRIADPAGEWMADPADPELMRRADAARGEVGRFRLATEGRDDDGDERFNEDGLGGTDVSRNFPHDYEWFKPGGGLGPVTTPESRALADLFATHPNIAAVYVLGLHDNVVKPWEGKTIAGISGNPQGTSAGGPFASSLPADNPWFAEVSRRFKRATGLSDAPSADAKGDFVAWSYFGMGRLAFGSRGWWVPKAPKAPADSVAKPAAPAPAPAPAPTPDVLADERNALAWARANDAFVDWAEVRTDGFDGKRVEVGGFAPFALLNPPASELDSVGARHTRFVAELAGMLPSITLRAVNVEPVDARVFRITAQVANDGYLPTHSAMGMRARWMRRVRVDFETGAGQQLVSGREVQQLDAIHGSGGSQTVTWTVVGDPGSSVTITAASPVAGTATQTITLRAQ